MKTVPETAARLTLQSSSILVFKEGGFCPPLFLQHTECRNTECRMEVPGVGGIKQQEFANSRNPAVLPRKTTIRKSKDSVLHIARELPHTEGIGHAAAGPTLDFDTKRDSRQALRDNE